MRWGQDRNVARLRARVARCHRNAGISQSGFEIAALRLELSPDGVNTPLEIVPLPVADDEIVTFSGSSVHMPIAP